MSKQAPNIIDVVAKAVDHFKRADYEAVQNLFKSKEYSQAIDAIKDDNSQEVKRLKNAVGNLQENMQTVISPEYSAILDDRMFVSVKKSIEVLESKNPPATKATLINELGNSLHGVVENISNILQQQSDKLNQHEKELLDKKGVVGYAIDVTKSRWSGKRNSDKEFTATFEVPAEISPSDILKNKKNSSNSLTSNPLNSFGNLAGQFENNVSPQEGATVPTTTIIEKTVSLGNKSAQEFNNVKLLDTPFKKCLAMGATIAGVVIAGHGIRNIYLAFNPDENENIELAELGHENTKGVNGVRLLVGAGEVVVGGIIAAQQITGRNIFDLNKPVEGKFTALCNHGDVPAIGGNGRG